MEINISVIIVTWNNEKDISECLESISDQTFKDYNIIVVDNASSDRTVSIVREKFPEVILIENEKNLFLTKGNNIGIKYAVDNFKPEFVMVLNPDTKVENNLLEVLYSKLKKDKSIGAVGPKIKFYKNQNENLINSAGILFDGFKQAYDLGFLEEDRGQFDNDRYVFGVTGACILYRTEMLKDIGLYWEKIKLYLDEIELFIRASKKNWKVLYTGDTTVWHNYMASTSQEKTERIDKIKDNAWLWISLRHYSIKSKTAMIRNYLFS